MLERIYAGKTIATEREMALVSEATLRTRAEKSVAHRRSLKEAIVRAASPAILAEIKPASPSAGVIAIDPDVAQIARAYEHAGATAISVLTERDHFAGDLAYLEQARGATALPLLRKDFLWTRYHVAQTAAFGADAFLLIVAGISDDVLLECLDEARSFALDVLVEVHDDSELERAVTSGAQIIGVNSRNLSSLGVDLRAGERLLRKVPPTICTVAESGIRDAADAARMVAAGANALLIGEALMRSASPSVFMSSLRRADRRLGAA